MEIEEKNELHQKRKLILEALGLMFDEQMGIWRDKDKIYSGYWEKIVNMTDAEFLEEIEFIKPYVNNQPEANQSTLIENGIKCAKQCVIKPTTERLIGQMYQLLTKRDIAAIQYAQSLNLTDKKNSIKDVVLINEEIKDLLNLF